MARGHGLHRRRSLWAFRKTHSDTGAHGTRHRVIVSYLIYKYENVQSHQYCIVTDEASGIHILARSKSF